VSKIRTNQGFGVPGQRKLKKKTADTTADEDASNPHGGTDGSKTLEAQTFVLIDVG
jgi:hypothetical protein